MSCRPHPHPSSRMSWLRNSVNLLRSGSGAASSASAASAAAAATRSEDIFHAIAAGDAAAVRAICSNSHAANQVDEVGRVCRESSRQGCQQRFIGHEVEATRIHAVRSFQRVSVWTTATRVVLPHFLHTASPFPFPPDLPPHPCRKGEPRSLLQLEMAT